MSLPNCHISTLGLQSRDSPAGAFDATTGRDALAVILVSYHKRQPIMSRWERTSAVPLRPDIVPRQSALVLSDLVHHC